MNSNNTEYQYIKGTLGKNIMKYPEFYLEWYRHWETSTGVIWRKNGIVNIKLICKKKIFLKRLHCRDYVPRINFLTLSITLLPCFELRLPCEPTAPHSLGIMPN